MREVWKADEARISVTNIKVIWGAQRRCLRSIIMAPKAALSFLSTSHLQIKKEVYL